MPCVLVIFRLQTRGWFTLNSFFNFPITGLGFQLFFCSTLWRASLFGTTFFDKTRVVWWLIDRRYLFDAFILYQIHVTHACWQIWLRHSTIFFCFSARIKFHMTTLLLFKSYPTKYIPTRTLMTHDPSISRVNLALTWKKRFSAC